MRTRKVHTGEPLIFPPKDQVLIAEKIGEACLNHHIAVVAYNVLPDHVHMITAAESEKELNVQVRKIKGYSSYAFQRIHQWELGQGIWAQKFNRRVIENETVLWQSVEYVMNNHLKHAGRWGSQLITTWNIGDLEKGLNPLSQVIRSMCVSVEEALMRK